MEDQQFDGLVAQARVQEAAARRGRRQWLQRQAAEEATLAGVLLDMAEGGCPVLIRSRSGSVHRGLVHGVGRDHVAVGDERAEVFVRLSAVVVVTSPTRGAVAGDREPAAGTSFRSVLADLSARRAPVRLVLGGDGGAAVTGLLTAVGRDLVVVNPTVGAPASYVPTSAIDEVIVT
jgi:hypothetical protein